MHQRPGRSTSAAESQDRLVVILDGFPDQAEAAAVARELGLPAGAGAEVRNCDETPRGCTISGADRSLHLRESTVVTPGREIRLRVMLSVEAEYPDGTSRAFDSLREVTIENDGGWHVTKDEVLIQT